MPDDVPKIPENEAAEAPATDWADLRTRAAKLGISLSDLQQQEREKKLRLARKFQSAAARKDAPQAD